ncbi:MAG: hypothetical protein D6732_12065 [Methanobacteriota archaeon]|nr:MAG: hypothetical protein D6732_12065 [Euryarchaeota archaeon]
MGGFDKDQRLKIKDQKLKKNDQRAKRISGNGRENGKRKKGKGKIILRFTYHAPRNTKHVPRSRFTLYASRISPLIPIRYH